MIGRIISHFRILEKLGQGGMGVVYKAQDLELDRPAALKFLTSEQVDEQRSTQRFLQEARAASALNHPNVITVYEIGKHEGRMYVATEFVEGKTLREMISPEGLGVDFTLQCVRQVVDGLRAAHSKGIVHRDIKPENLMVTADARIKIMDFGLARTLGGQEQITRTGTILGTAPYMSPEQVNGTATDHRTDIYSLGAVLYEMLSGRPPFPGEYPVAIMYAVVNREPTPLEELRADIPPDLCRIVARCLQKAPGDRYQSCDEIEAAVTALQALPFPESAPGPRQAERIHLLLPPEIEVRRNIVGRTEHLRALESRIQGIDSGHGRTLFICGESGIGKTHLVAGAARHAAKQGYAVLWGRCLFQEAGLPYHPIAAALRNMLHGASDDTLQVLARRAAGQGLSLGGRLASIRAFLRISSDPVSLQNREQLWDAVLLVLRLLTSDCPIICVIDDMQWADKESIGLFSFIARNIADVPFLLVGIYRTEMGTGERGSDLSPLAETIRQLNVEGLSDEIEVDRLSESETAEFLRQALQSNDADTRVVKHLYAFTAGNPLFTRELLNLMKESGAFILERGRWQLKPGAEDVRIPNRIHEVITRRLGRLSTEEREMLEIASCDGNQFSSDILAACLRTDRLTLLRRLQSFEKEHALIRHEKSTYRFDHPLIRQVLYDGILPELREEYHRLIADSLVNQAGSDPALASRIAHHLRASSRESAALEYLVKAANHARTLYANNEAFELYSRARTILSRQDQKASPLMFQVEEGLGDVALSSGRSPEAAKHFSEMLRLAAQGTDIQKIIEANRKLANALRIQGEIPRALELAEHALQLSQSFGPPALQIECLNSLAFIHAARAEYDQTISFSEEALVLARQHADDRNAAVSLSNLGLACVHTGAYRTAVDRLNEARTLQEFIGDRKGLGFTLNYLALANHRLARYETALENAHASLEMKKSIADIATIPGALNILGDLYRDVGDVATAQDYHMRSLELAREQNNRGSECDNLRDLGADFLIQGNTDQARKYLAEVLSVATAHGYTWYETRGHITLTELHMALGELQRAEASALRGEELARTLKAQELIAEALWKKALVADRSGRHEDAAASLREAIATARACGHEIFLWQMHKDLGRVLDACGQTREAADARRTASELIQTIAEGIGNPDRRGTFLQWSRISGEGGSPS